MKKLDKYASFGEMSLHEEGDWVLHSVVKEYSNQRVIEELERFLYKNSGGELNGYFFDINDHMIYNRIKQLKQ